VRVPVTLLVSLSALLGASPASAEEAPAAPLQDAPKVPSRAFDRRQVMTRMEIGYRGSFIANAGYNPFSTNDYLPQFSLAALRTILARHRFAFASGIAWDFASTGATDRGGDNASLTLHRLTLPLEGRAHFGEWGYVFLRVAPGVALVSASIDDLSSPAPLTKARWLFATDASVGYNWLLMPRGGALSRVGRMWLQTDVGYGWMASERLNLVPAGASGVDLGTLTLSGAFFRVALAASL
jgi:hypothetical protein